MKAGVILLAGMAASSLVRAEPVASAPDEVIALTLEAKPRFSLDGGAVTDMVDPWGEKPMAHPRPLERYDFPGPRYRALREEAE